MAIVKAEIRPRLADGTYNDIIYPKTSTDMVEGLQAALNAKANTSHTHTPAQVGLSNVNNWGASSAISANSTTQYATTNMVAQVRAEKANRSHGNHVPATQSANARVFLRNDNTWRTLPSATTGATGIVQLNNTVTSTSTTQAATANAVKLAYDRGTQALNSVGKSLIPSNSLKHTLVSGVITNTHNTNKSLGFFTPPSDGLVAIEVSAKHNSTSLSYGGSIRIIGCYMGRFGGSSIHTNLREFMPVNHDSANVNTGVSANSNLQSASGYEILVDGLDKSYVTIRRVVQVKKGLVVQLLLSPNSGSIACSCNSVKVYYTEI